MEADWAKGMEEWRRRWRGVVVTWERLVSRYFNPMVDWTGDVAENNGIYHGIVKAILKFELITLLFPKKPGFCLYPLYPSRVELNKKRQNKCVYIQEGISKTVECGEEIRHVQTPRSKRV